MIINPIRRAVERGRQQERADIVAFLYAQADLHQGQPSDQKRRGALHHAADRIRDGREPGRAVVPVEVITLSEAS